MDLMKALQERAAKKCPRIIFPEASDRRIVDAAVEAARLGVARPILVGSSAAIGALGVDLGGIPIVDPAVSAEKIGAFAERYSEEVGLSTKSMLRRLPDPLNFAATMLRAGEADGMVAGFTYGTEAVVMASQIFVGLSEGVQLPSSFFVMDVPAWSGGEDGLIVFADCAVAVNPTSQELASIALSTAASVRTLLGWEPRIAMISFSTKGSATHPDVDKVVEAYRVAKEAEPTLCIDGELQVDSAIVPAVSDKKIKGESVLKGRANVLIFPDLDAANAAYKLVQRLAGAAAYGPVLQGFTKPVSDLSKGATFEDIVGATTIVAAHA